jgi:hypothetical protein
MEEVTQDKLERLNEAIPMMLLELISLAGKGEIDLAHKTAGVILNEVGEVIDFSSKVLEKMMDHSAP